MRIVFRWVRSGMGWRLIVAYASCSGRGIFRHLICLIPVNKDWGVRLVTRVVISLLAAGIQRKETTQYVLDGNGVQGQEYEDGHRTGKFRTP